MTPNRPAVTVTVRVRRMARRQQTLCRCPLAWPARAACLNYVSPILACPAEGASMGRMTWHLATPQRLGAGRPGP